MNLYNFIKKIPGNNSFVHKANPVLQDFLFLLFSYFTLLTIFITCHSLRSELWVLSNWNFIELSALKYGIATFIYLCALSILFWIKENKLKKLFLFFTSMTFASLLYGSYAITFFIIAFLFYKITYLNLKITNKIGLFFILFELFAYLTLNYFYKSNFLFWYAFIFSYFFFFRFLFFIYHNITNSFNRENFLDYILFIFHPAYFLILPHIIILPQYNHFKKSWALEQNDFIQTSKAGLKKILMGFFYLILWKVGDAIETLYLPATWDLKNHSLLLNFTGILANFILWMLVICAYGNILLGLIYGLGHKIKSPFRKPFYSKNIIDLYDRFLLHFKDFIMIFFYFPSIIYFRKLPIYLRSFFSALIAITLGTLLNLLLTLGFETCSAEFNDIRGEAGILESYKSEFLMIFEGKFQETIFHVSFYDLHMKLFYLLIPTLIFGSIFAAQLTFQVWINSKNSSHGTMRRICLSPIGMIIEYIIMLLVVFIFL